MMLSDLVQQLQILPNESRSETTATIAIGIPALNEQAFFPALSEQTLINCRIPHTVRLT
jgi:hypothetical protein